MTTASTFTINDGSDHNLWPDGSDRAAEDQRISDDVGVGESAVKSVRVTAGTWRLYCSLPNQSSTNRALIVI